MEIKPLFSIKHFGKEYVLQNSSENPETFKQAETVWKEIGHSVIHKKDKQNPKLVHLYASRYKTRNY